MFTDVYDIFGFGACSKHNSIKEAAKKSNIYFIVSKNHLAEYDPERCKLSSKSEIISAYKAYKRYGMKAFNEIIDYGSAIV